MTQYRDMTDRELVDAYAAGDNAAFDEIWRRYLPDIRRTACSITRRACMADDVVSRVGEYLARAIHKWEGRNGYPLGSWIANSTRCRAINHLRTAAYRERHEESIHAHGENDAPMQLPARSRPDRDIMLAEQMDIVMAAFTQLTPRHRDMLHQFAVENKRMKIIAAENGIQSIGTVKSSISRARAELRQIIKGMQND